MKEKVYLWYNRICDIFELYVPSLIFVFMFLSYAVLIFYRYVLSVSFSWLYELNTLSFVWCGIFASSYGSRAETHVNFTILYDHVSPIAQTIMRFVGNLFIIVTFLIMFPGALKNLQFMAVRKSSILKIPYNLVFSPFIIFMVLTILHHILLLSRDIVSLVRREKKEVIANE